MSIEEGSKEYEEAGADRAVDLLAQIEQLQAELNKKNMALRTFINSTDYEIEQGVTFRLVPEEWIRQALQGKEGSEK